MGYLHSPNLSCYALDRIEFWPLIYRSFKFKGLFFKKCPTAPPNKISGYATDQSLDYKKRNNIVSMCQKIRDVIYGACERKQNCINSSKVREKDEVIEEYENELKRFKTHYEELLERQEKIFALGTIDPERHLFLKENAEIVLVQFDKRSFLNFSICCGQHSSNLSMKQKYQ